RLRSNGFSGEGEMDFEFTEEQKILRDTVRKFVIRECPREVVRAHDEEERFPAELFEKMAALGWMGIPYPERYGGLGGNAIDLTIVLEEIARGMRALATAYYATVVLGGQAIYHGGTEDQKLKYIPLICQGEIKLALSLTEPNAGSDLASLSTTATVEDDHFLINGQKTFCTLADQAHFIVMAVRTQKDAPKHRGISLVIVPGNQKGMTIRKIPKLGIRAISACEIFLSDVRIPKENLLGDLNQGWTSILKTLDMERLTLAAVAVGDTQAILEEALSHAKERVQFGQPIGKFQLIQAMLADMRVELEAARLLTYHLAWLISEGRPCHMESSIAKLYASEACMRAAVNGMQILGGYGYTMEYDMQRHFRDAKINEIGGGSSQIQRLIISREMGL
ncbi:MAG: acyl-CoA dehydrogenase family protein, partial [Candidatus Bathyarchaeia archaeon]